MLTQTRQISTLGQVINTNIQVSSIQYALMQTRQTLTLGQVINANIEFQYYLSYITR